MPVRAQDPLPVRCCVWTWQHLPCQLNIHPTAPWAQTAMPTAQQSQQHHPHCHTSQHHQWRNLPSALPLAATAMPANITNGAPCLVHCHWQPNPLQLRPDYLAVVQVLTSNPNPGKCPSETVEVRETYKHTREALDRTPHPHTQGLTLAQVTTHASPLSHIPYCQQALCCACAAHTVTFTHSTTIPSRTAVMLQHYPTHALRNTMAALLQRNTQHLLPAFLKL